MSEETTFRRRHGKKILVGSGSAGIGAALALLWPQVEQTLSGIMDAKAITARLDTYETRAHRLEAEQDALRTSIESLKQSRDYQQGLLDGIRQQAQAKIETVWYTNTVHSAEIKPEPWDYPKMTNLWHELTNRNFRMSQFRSPDGEINVWYNEQQKGMK